MKLLPLTIPIVLFALIAFMFLKPVEPPQENISVGTVKIIDTIVQEQNILEDTDIIRSLIESDRQPNGKYKRRDEQVIRGVTYRVDEYDASGNLGYIVTITKEEDGIIYQQKIATGVEKVYREHDWIQIGNNNPTATSTP